MNTQKASFLQDKIIGNLFFESSTRTHCSFQAAIQRAGGYNMNVQTQYSSMNKGESPEDTVKTMEQYCDGLIIRHPDIQFVHKCAEYSNVPIINAGNGNGEHPTQALLDLFTIKQSHMIDTSLKIAFTGDLKNSRTCHSLIRLLDRIHDDYLFYFISPHELRLGHAFLASLRNKYVCGTTLEEHMTELDILYMTRLQKERITDMTANIENVKITNELLNRGKDTMILMHPLPRNDEISVCCDTNKRSKYFDQMKYGVYVRMAIMEYMMNKKLKK
jgi:aspartate carbamoyltransferase